MGKFSEDPIKVENHDISGFPTEVFPNWIKNYVEMISEEFETSVDLVSNAALSALATSLLKKFVFYSKDTDWKLDLNLYILLGAPPGSKKDAVIQKVFEPIYDLDEQEQALHKQKVPQIQSRLDMFRYQYERLLKKTNGSDKNQEDNEEKLEELKEKISNLESLLEYKHFLIGGDITQEKLGEMIERNDGSISVVTGEASELVDHISGRYNNKSMDLLLKAWEGNNATSFRKTREGTILFKPLLNLNLFTQPSVISSMRGFADRGLIQRFLLTNIESKSESKNFPKLNLSSAEKEVIKDNFESNLLKLFHLSVENKPTEVEVSEDVKSFYHQVKQQVKTERDNEDLSEMVREWEEKAFGNIMKVVTLLAIATKFQGDNLNDLKLEHEDLIKALKLYQHYSKNFRKAFKMLSSNVLQSDLSYLFSRLLDLEGTGTLEKGLVSSTVMNNYVRKYRKDERIKLLEVLEDHNLILIKRDGRAITVQIHPEILKLPRNEAMKFIVR
ncbi:DUF3987 domain-containing protein [Alkalibacillus sp. S2W]|uniref:DUF3987 domain-containing protein n=1 Tax=Alkalibacillus sp. S2W TaxID=3386553 RepID=UPI00398D445A